MPVCNCESNRHPSPHSYTYRVEIALLFALWLCHSAANFWWLKVDTRPPYSDTAGHAVLTLQAALQNWPQIIREGQLFQEIGRIQPYPPLFYLTSIPFAVYLWPAVDAIVAVNTLYFGVLLFSTYGIGRLLVGGRGALLAALFVSLYPILYGLSRVYLIDVPLTAMTTLAIFCLFWSDLFRRFWPSLLLGVAIGLATLTKWTFVLFLLGPLAIALYDTMRHPTRLRLLNVALAGTVSLAVGAPWYLHNYELLQRFLQNNGFLAAQLENDPALWTLASFGYYLTELVREQILLPFFLLFVLGTGLTLRRCKLDLYLWMLLAWILVGYVLSSLIINKDTRYTMPLLPALALLTAIGWVQIRQAALQRVGLALIVLYALVQYAGLTVGLSNRLAWMPSTIGWPQHAPVLTFYTERVHMAERAHAENWQVDALLEAILEDARGRPAQEGAIQLVVIPNMPYFDAQAFIYTKWRDRLDLDVSFITGILEVESGKVLEDSDYVVTKSGDQGWAFAMQDAGEITAQLLDANSTLRSHYELLAEFPLPDRSAAQLFRRLDAPEQPN